MRKWLILILIFASIVVLSSRRKDFFEAESSGSSLEPVVVFQNGTTVNIRIADDMFERARGLSGQESLESNEGLLFLHDERGVKRYWMKGMLIPIDIIWIDGKEVVGFVQEAKPEEPPLTLYKSPVPVDKVLEVSAGFVAKNNVKVGDILDIQLTDE